MARGLAWVDLPSLSIDDIPYRTEHGWFLRQNRKLCFPLPNKLLFIMRYLLHTMILLHLLVGMMNERRALFQGHPQRREPQFFRQVAPQRPAAHGSTVSIQDHG